MAHTVPGTGGQDGKCKSTCPLWRTVHPARHESKATLVNPRHTQLLCRKSLCHEDTEQDLVEGGRGDLSEEGMSELSSEGRVTHPSLRAGKST